MKSIELPPRMTDQSLDGYVLEHLPQLEQVLAVGVPYRALREATLAAGFAKMTVLSLRCAMKRARRKGPSRRRVPPRHIGGPSWLSPTPTGLQQASQVDDDDARLRRRFRELTHAPRPGTNEKDPVI
jgi:hypothetical protein